MKLISFCRFYKKKVLQLEISEVDFDPTFREGQQDLPHLAEFKAIHLRLKRMLWKFCSKAAFEFSMHLISLLIAFISASDSDAQIRHRPEP